MPNTLYAGGMAARLQMVMRIYLSDQGRGGGMGTQASGTAQRLAVAGGTLADGTKLDGEAAVAAFGRPTRGGTSPAVHGQAVGKPW